MKTKVLSLFLIAVSLSLPRIGAAQEAAKKKVFIVPLVSSVDVATYNESTAENVRQAVSKSLNTFIGILPFVDAPNYSESQVDNWNPSEISNFAEAHNAQYVVFGELNFTGSASDPIAEIGIHVWSKSSTNLFSGYYKTRLDLSLFDTVDDMLVEVVQKTFDIVANISIVSFKNFRIANDIYKIYGNNQLISVASNSSFGYEMRVLANTPYHFVIERQRDGKKVIDTTLTLDPGYSTNISYSGTAGVNIGRIVHANRRTQYQVLLNGRSVHAGETVSNLVVNMDHSLMLLDQDSNILNKQSFTLRDGELRRISPVEPNHPRSLYMRVYTGQNSMLGVGVNLYMFNRLWLGANFGYSLYPTSDTNYNVLYPSVEIGFSFAYIKEVDMRFSVGAFGGYYHALIPEAADFEGGTFGLFFEYQWKFLYARLLLGKDSQYDNGPFFGPSIGVRF